jgi:hypothetical protein
MCYPYRVVCERTVEVVVRSEDRTTRRVALRPFRPEAEMKELLRAALRAEGWAEADGGGDRFEKAGPAGELQTFDVERLELEARVSAEETVKKTRRLEGGAYTERHEGPTDAEKVALEEKVQQELARAVVVSPEEEAARRAALALVAAGTLQSGEARRLEELDQVLGRVYGAALRRMAESMGEVVSEKVSRDGGETELLIEIDL